MAYPFQVSGACASTQKNVFRAKWTVGLSSVPELRAYDDAAAYPVTDTTTSTNYGIFKGTTANSNLPMVVFLDTSKGGPATTGWYTGAVYGVAKATARMAGDASYLKFRAYATTVAAANASVQWNAVMLVPNDTFPTVDRTHNIVFRYTFTGSAPTITFNANNLDAGGTDASPAWGTITTDTHGVRFSHGAATAGNIIATIPLSGILHTKKAWVTTS